MGGGSLKIPLKDRCGVGMINTTKESCHPRTRILTVVSYFKLSKGCQLQKCSDNLGHFLQVHTIKRLAAIKRRENNRTAWFSFARYDVILR